MPPKRPPAPIDRPLSKAYLRQFLGWSTAAPPGMSQPNSLREMRNVMITRDGGARVRPGMRSLLRTKSELELLGSHELFYTNEGERAYLVAVREPDGEKVGFRVLTYVDDDSTSVEMLTLVEAGFTLLDDNNSVEFSQETTQYVRYLQMDNKIFALSNGPEPMIMFWVGEEKKAKRLSQIDRPSWALTDRLSVVHPDAAWISNADVTATRVNECRNPSFVHGTSRWRPVWNAKIARATDQGVIGGSSMAIQSLPVRINYCHHPLNDPLTYGIAQWTYTHNAARVSLAPSGDALRTHVIGTKKEFGSAYSSLFHMPTTSGKQFRASFDLGDSANLEQWNIRIKFYNSAKESMGLSVRVGGTRDVVAGRHYSDPFTIPNGCHYVRIIVGGLPAAVGVTTWFDIKNVFLGDTASIASGDLAALDGDMTDVHTVWEGVAHNSRSLYHPPQDVGARHEYVSMSGSVVGSSYVRTSTGGHDVDIRVHARNAAGTETHLNGDAVATTGWTRHSSGVYATPSDTTAVDVTVIFRSLGRGETAYVDGVQLEKGAALTDFFHGSYPVATSTVRQRWSGRPHDSASMSETFGNNSHPVAETKTSNTLISSNSGQNVYNFGFFYTISNELGESAASRVSLVKVQRQWSSWKWETANAAGEPSGTSTDVPALCADQLSVFMPEDVFNRAIVAGATKWDAYFYSWGPNDVSPVSAIHFASIPLTEDSVYGVDSWARLTPEQKAISEKTPLVPTEKARVDSTSPSIGAQGIVANDRLVLVGAPTDPARIVWSGGELGDFHNFSPSSGGGSKVLTSGNLYLTACVKLWQNPQSVDTLTILNRGEDGRSNAYYMQPATITSMSESIQVMGFEEATGMEGTASPYGCEVVNNALYHPLEKYLVKSTANNYNLSHRTVSDEIENVWQTLQNMHRIVSCVLDGRIYFLVHNPRGDLLQDGCWGNEVWVLDTVASTPTWSRWLIQGVSLRTMSYANQVVLSVIRPDGIFALDPRRTTDEVFEDIGAPPVEKPISWYLETNTQGANRAHDAWANLQQVNVTLGGFRGQMAYGIRGKDVNGMDIDMSKVVVATHPPALVSDSDDEVEVFLSPKDLEDFFLIRKMMKEWVFFAGSVEDVVIDPDGPDRMEPRYSSGQLNFVQYRYTPATVNVGYEFGSIETFEYGSSAAADATTDSGTPTPYLVRE